ncbi:MAG: protein-export chaperone SecB [Kiloniellales bacterium]
MAEARSEPLLLIQAQYIKDLSFENPNAPDIYAAISDNPPEITVNIDVNPAPRDNRAYEVVLSFRIAAMSGEQAAFLIELDYAGIVTVHTSVPDEDIERLLLTEVPRLLFPFARSTLAEVTREGSFPPLVINPIDFEQFYHHHKKGSTVAAGSGAAVASEA